MYMVGEITTTMKASDNITELANKVTLCDVVLNTKVACDTVTETAIQKSFRWYGIHEDMGCQDNEPLGSHLPVSN